VFCSLFNEICCNLGSLPKPRHEPRRNQVAPTRLQARGSSRPRSLSQVIIPHGGVLRPFLGRWLWGILVLPGNFSKSTGRPVSTARPLAAAEALSPQQGLTVALIHPYASPVLRNRWAGFRPGSRPTAPTRRDRPGGRPSPCRAALLFWPASDVCRIRPYPWPSRSPPSPGRS
jgi:hypothetical protein